MPAATQPEFLDARCDGDSALRDAVMEMLREDARGASLLDRELAQTAEQLLGSGDSAQLPPQRFGPYRIRQLLGEGGMGVVYLAVRDDLGSLAAIKILRDAWLSPSRRERFAAEQRTLAQLNHPAIARLYDADSLPDGTPWFAMELVEGLPLAAYCAQRSSPLLERLRLFRAVCEAVQHAHQHLVVHRDLKPSNILVTATGAIKLLDFGIAKQLESLDRTHEQTRTALRLMTPAYAAPEQISGGPIGVHTDVYALGVVLFELLTGRVPFEVNDRTPGGVEAAILTQAPERPSLAARATVHRNSVGRAAWSDLDVLCLKALHKDPERRYRTVEALIRDVDHYLAGEPLEARPESLGYRVGKFARRNRGPLAVAGLTFALVIGLVGFYTVRLAGARNAALAEAARAQRIQRFTLSLFEGGDKEAGPADSLRVVTLVDRGLREARSLTAEPAVQAEVYATLGGIYQQLGNLPRAESLAVQALAQRQRLFGAASAEVVGSLVRLAEVRIAQAQYAAAQQLALEALQAGRAQLPASHPALAEATLALGRALQERGKYDSAIVVSEEAVLRYGAAGKPTPELGAALSQLADDHFYAGNYATADSLNQQVLTIYTAVYGERHPRVAAVIINMGAAQQERGHYPEAELLHRRGLAIIRGFYGEDHHETAYALTMLARTLVFEEKAAEAASLLEKALAVRERVYGPNHPSVASTVNELGNVAMSLGRLDDAEGYFSRMAQIYRIAYGGRHQYVGVAQSNLASVYGRREQWARAEALYREVIALYREILPPTHLNVGITRIKLGRALLRQKRYQDAAAESLAGYEILVKQSNPGISFLRAARTDLALAYDALREPEQAARFRKELADSAGGAARR